MDFNQCLSLGRKLLPTGLLGQTEHVSRDLSWPQASWVNHNPSLQPSP